MRMLSCSQSYWLRSNGNGDAGLRKQKHKAIMAEESCKMAQKAQGTDSTAFDSAAGVISWFSVASAYALN